MLWHVAEAKQKFLEVLRATSTEPQSIFNRDRWVAAVVEAQTYERLQVWPEQQCRSTLAEAFTSLRQLCSANDYTLSVPTRQERTNAFVETRDDVSL